MKRYKISESNLKEFFGWFGRKNPPQKIQQLIDDDPQLQQLRADFSKINHKYDDYFEKVKKENPELWKIMQSTGLTAEGKKK